jgi:hypothetical protein
MARASAIPKRCGGLRALRALAEVAHTARLPFHTAYGQRLRSQRKSLESAEGPSSYLWLVEAGRTMTLRTPRTFFFG